MRLLTDPDEDWPSVGTLRISRQDAEPGSSRSGALQPVAWLRRAISRVAQPRAAGAAFDADSLIPALSSIRSSAEILRDTPDIGAAERRRFAEIVLAEEARLEAMVKKFAGESKLAR